MLLVLQVVEGGGSTLKPTAYMQGTADGRNRWSLHLHVGTAGGRGLR